MRQLLFGLFLCCLLLSSCTYLRQLAGAAAEKPQVHLVDVDIRSLSGKRMELNFVLEVFNPNNFSVDIERLDYQVRSLDLDLGEGFSNELIHLGAEEKVTVRLPFQVDPDNIVTLMKKYLQNPKELKVKLKANLYLNTLIGKMDMHFEEEKTIMKGLSNF